MNSIPYTISEKAIVLMIDSRTYTINRADQRFPDVLGALRDGNYDEIPGILDLKGRLVSESNGGLYLLNGMLRCDKYPVPALLGTRIIEMNKMGFPIDPLAKFLENLMENPSPSAREELYGFIEACDLPITADGYFLAYKMVGSNFKDLYTGKMDNSVGRVLLMPREDVDSNRNRTCSSGLHFCSEGYLGQYGTRGSDQVVVLKINPRDVVSIPTDYNNAKGRACQYEVVDAISWDDVITPWFTEEYSDVDTDGDEPLSGLRWEVRNKSDDSLVARFSTRQNAREHIWYNNSNDEDWYVRDRQQGDPDPDLDDDYDDSDDGDSEWNLDWDEGLHDEPDTPTPPPASTPGAVLTEDKVREIHHRLIMDNFDSYTSLGREYGVSDRTIRRIRDGESWTHITRQ